MSSVYFVAQECACSHDEVFSIFIYGARLCEILGNFRRSSLSDFAHSPLKILMSRSFPGFPEVLTMLMGGCIGGHWVPFLTLGFTVERRWSNDEPVFQPFSS